MDTQRKLERLADAGRFDLACACGTKDPAEHRRRDPSGEGRWLYPVSLPSGGRGIMLKTLVSSACVNDCAYCPLRAGRDAEPRCTLEVDELARAFLDMDRRRKLLGIFVSSGVIRSPDHAMDRLVAVAARLRRRYGYRGYIHLKVIPGASDAAIAEAMNLATAVSVNIEAPDARHCADIAPRKNWEDDILRPMRTIHRLARHRPDGRRIRQTTQFIVGAGRETDREIVARAASLYRDLSMERVYFSAYQRGMGAASLPGERADSAAGDRLTREHRLYQTDFLLRKYRFPPEDIPFDADGNLGLDADPKQRWADAHPEYFPVRAKTASMDELLRVPGLGPLSAKRIVAARKAASRLEDLPITAACRRRSRRYLIWE